MLYLDMTDFVSRYSPNDIVGHIESDVVAELKEVFPDVNYGNNNDLADCFGFTTDEARALCAEHNMDYDTLAEWYDGYKIGSVSGLFNPTSVMTALYNQYCDSYWSNTGAYDTVATYIRMNFDGLKDDVIRLLAGGSCSVDTSSFQNDMNVVRSKDDVLTLLIHLGYLTYDRDSRTCWIPNREVAAEFKNAAAGLPVPRDNIRIKIQSIS